MVVPTGDLADSDGPLLEVVKQGPLGIPEKLFSAIGLLALSNGALINMIMASRLLYGMSRGGRRAARLRHGPARAGARRGSRSCSRPLLAAVLVSTGDLETLADTTVALLVVVFAIVNVCRARPAPRGRRARALRRAVGRSR